MSLTEAAIQFKRISKFFIAFVVLYYIWLLIISPLIGKAIRQIIYKQDPPTASYGLLPPLEFVEKPISDVTPTYVLNTRTGKLPADKVDRMLVYKYSPPSFSYMAGENAVKDAQFLGFQPGDLITDLKGDTYKWKSLQTDGTLEIKTGTKELRLITNLANKGYMFPKGMLDDNVAIRTATTLFTTLRRFDDPMYVNGTQKVFYGEITSTGINQVDNPRNAQVALVDFFRSFKDYKILGTDPAKGLLRVILRRPSQDTPAFNYPLVEAYYWEFENRSTATYPIITYEEAWNAIRAGKGVVTNVTPKGANPFGDYAPTRVENILIDNIYLGYYDTPKQQKFMQPIYVFEGKYTTRGTDGGSITLYFPAITRDYIQSNAK